MKEIGIYIHIPFCKQKCLYCDFVSFPKGKDIQEKYVKALLKEIELMKNVLQDKKIQTIYIGGGTPSYIDSKYIKQIISNLELKNRPKEITIEVNPGTVTKEKMQDYKEAGINRLSIGLQETDDTLLKQIGRIHTYKDFLNTYKLAKEIGFNNINVDLMIGLPNQTIKNIKSSLEKILELQPTHISVYSLIIEEETKIKELIDKNILKLPDEELERNMYWYVKDYLELNGFTHYEVSNFAKQGYPSYHNLSCWNQEEYIGLGAASHSYLNKVRYSNTEDLDKYIKNCNSRQIEKNKQIWEVQTKEDMQKEYMMLGLRKIDGISIQKFKNKFGENPIYIYREELNYLASEKLIVVQKDKIKLTARGLDIANQVWQQFT